jgi:glycosyltransferase involved in cell wall biosynthesis
VTPLLSICIPTRNRAETLRLALRNVVSEAAPLAGRVEVVVSDNASTDHTAAVLAEQGAQVRWQVRPENIGYFRNMVGMAGELARGRFLWMLGDDDMILRGGLARALRHLEQRPDLEFFYLNYSWIPLAERNRRITEEDSRADVDIGACNFTTAATLDVPRLEQLALAPNRNASGLFCGMFSYLLPRDFYRRFAGTGDGQRFDCFSPVLEDIYPHAKILLAGFLDRPARLIGEPCLLQGVGGWEWKPYEVCYKLTPLQQLLEFVRGLGPDPAVMARMEADFDRTAGRNFARMLLDPAAHQGLETVLLETLPRLRHRPGFWRAFFAGARESGRPGWERGAMPILERVFTDS